jgi:general secretion pathway protein E/type IV pilus assembly protein PilB
VIDKRRIIEETLKNLGILNDKQIEEALKVQLDTQERFSEVLVKLGYISAANLGQSLISQFGLIPVDLSEYEIPTEITSEIPPKIAMTHHLVPVEKKHSVIKVVTDDPLNFLAIDNLSNFCGKNIELELTVKKQFHEIFEKNYGGEREEKKTFDVIVDRIGEEEIPLGVTLAEEEVSKEEAPIIRLVSLLITEAIKNRASDIHIEPLEKKLRIRYRIDGVLHEVPGPPQRLQGSVISRIKLMANLDIAEKRLPQDGRIRINLLGRSLDLRVSTLPGIYGESTVLRILDKSSLLMDLNELGFLAEDQQKFEELISMPNGMILVTGPTGSGKTTTLYAALSKINQPNKKIITVEEPVEYQISGINQVQVKPHIGLTFASGLRSMLRQAPDVILVGEIRDFETATIAIQAALTGHLIFSTLHTNDAAGAVTRLIDMGVKPYLVASTVQAVLAQRLVRKVCSSCKKPYQPSEDELAALDLKAKDIKDITFYQGTGCDECSLTGYKGRTGIFELLIVNDRLRELFFEKVSSTVIRDKARQMGMRTLREDGMKKVLSGITTLAEVIRVTQSDIE